MSSATIPLFVICAILNIKPSSSATVACSSTYTITPIISVLPTTTIYIPECTSNTVQIGQVNASLYGTNTATGFPESVNYFTPTTDGGTLVTAVPALSGTMLNLQWDMTANNTCMSIVNATATPVNCQFTLYLKGFSASNYIDYESLSSSGFALQATAKVYRATSSGCTWSAQATIYVGFQDCNEKPVIQSPTTGTIYTIFEYDRLSAASTYVGSICNLYVTDPDIYSGVYGTVTLAITSVYRPNAANATADASPFFIYTSTFFANNSAISVLKYDVTRCTNVTGCLAMFAANVDGGNYTVYAIVVTATDSGGLNMSTIVNLKVTQIVPTPVWVNMPGNVTIAEASVGPLQIFPIQMRILNPGSLVFTPQISIVSVNPVVNATTGLTYMGIDNNCYPNVSSSIICSGLNLTSQVTNTTFNYLLVRTYNVTIMGLIIPPVGSGLSNVAITSYVLVNIDGYNRQPILSVTNAAVSIPEDVRYPGCVYNLSTIPQDPNGDTLFTYTIKSVTQTGYNNMWYMLEGRVCYNGGTGKSIGSCCDRVFTKTITPYVLNIEIKDQYSTPTPYPTFTLTVTIDNAGNPPTLTPPSQPIAVLENATSLSFVVNGTQNNPPTNFTRPLIFNITGVSRTYNGMYFTMSQNATNSSGYATITAVSPNTPLFNAIAYPLIYLNITLADSVYTVSTTLTVSVLYVRTGPSITNLPNATSLSESVTGTSAFYTVLASDRDNDPISYSFVNGSGLQPTYAFFSIGYYSGVVYYVNPALNYYQTATHTLWILAQDHPTTSTTNNATNALALTVAVIPLNRAPTFIYPPAGSGQAGSTFSLNDNLAGQAKIITFNATDREGDKIYYNITSMTPTWNYALNLDWGMNFLEYNQNFVSSTWMFNYYTTPVYTIIVEVKDIPHLTSATSTTTLTISIVDPPAEFVGMPGYVTVQEDAYYGPTELYAVAATDPNNGNLPVTVLLKEIVPSSGSGKFYFDTYSKIFGYNSNPQFIYSSQNSYTAIFTASNTISPTVTSSVVITVTPVTATLGNSQYNYTVTIREDTNSSLLLWDLRTRNNQTSMTYSLLQVSPLSSAFTVSTGGLVKCVSNPAFSYKQVPVYTVFIGASYNGQISTFTLTVSLTPVVRRPVIRNLPTFLTIQEGTARGLDLYQVNCTDSLNSGLTWSLAVLPISGTANFIVTSSGLVKSTDFANFTYLVTPVYRVLPGCSNGQYTVSSTLTVVILPITTTTTTGTTATYTTATGAIGSTTTDTSGDSSALTPEQIGAIVGSIGGALVLAGVAFGVAKLLQKQAAAKGLTKMMKPSFVRR